MVELVKFDSSTEWCLKRGVKEKYLFPRDIKIYYGMVFINKEGKTCYDKWGQYIDRDTGIRKAFACRGYTVWGKHLNESPEQYAEHLVNSHGWHYKKLLKPNIISG